MTPLEFQQAKVISDLLVYFSSGNGTAVERVTIRSDSAIVAAMRATTQEFVRQLAQEQQDRNGPRY